jgi:monoamine oxidase
MGIRDLCKVFFRQMAGKWQEIRVSVTRHQPERRKLLKVIAGLAIVGRPVGGNKGRDRGRRILVVGGGLAGLAVLDALVETGHSARLLEASPRMGGRILTLRQGLAPGLRAEAGAEQIPQAHYRVRALAAKLKISLVDYPVNQGAFVFRHGNRIIRFHHPSDLPPELTEGLSPQEKAAWPYRLHLLYAKEAEPVADEDPRSGLQWLRDLGLTQRGAIFVKAFSTIDPESISAAAFQRMSQQQVERGNSQIIKDGTDHLIQAMAARYESLISQNTKIEKVIFSDERVVLIDETGLTHVADHVVLALPLRPLLALDFQPRMPQMVAAWRAARRPAFELKVHAQIQSAEFHALGISQYAMGLDFPHMTWALPEISPDGQIVLNATASGKALALVQSQRARSSEALEKLLRARLHWFRTLRVATLGENWNSDPLIGGASAYTPAGKPFSPLPVSENLLTLAGSDFSQHPGWMEGALESAERAVKILKDSLKS